MIETGTYTCSPRPIPSIVRLPGIVEEIGQGRTNILSISVVPEAFVRDIPDETFNEEGRDRRGGDIVFLHLVIKPLENAHDALETSPCLLLFLVPFIVILFRILFHPL